jgi:pimeloyl-ACP methyl ester carboxylesterase
MIDLFHDLLKKPLELKKTHDFCPSETPQLTVVFIHGIASSSTAFSRTLKYLEGTISLKNIRYVTYDLLGSGKSYKSDKLNYNYTDQITALENSLEKLRCTTPLVLVGHSMGALIATRYAYDHKKAVQQLILCSSPVYTEKDLDNPAFNVAMSGFKEAVSVKNRKILKEKAFNQSIEKIVKNRKNYERLCNITTPTVLIYGNLDKIIAAHNIPKLVKSNSKYLSAIRVPGRHGMSREKYMKIKEILEDMLYKKS